MMEKNCVCEAYGLPACPDGLSRSWLAKLEANGNEGEANMEETFVALLFVAASGN